MTALPYSRTKIDESITDLNGPSRGQSYFDTHHPIVCGEGMKIKFQEHEMTLRALCHLVYPEVFETSSNTVHDNLHCSWVESPAR